MKSLVSAGAIIFRREKEKIYYLLLKYAAINRVEKSYWGFVKGVVEKGERKKETILREVYEETSINDLKFIKGFKITNEYCFKIKNDLYHKKVYYLLAETKTKKIKLSFEHLDYKWLLYQEAIKKLSFENDKKILEKANEFLGKSLSSSKENSKRKSFNI
ncbi:MAG TPA: NUDIX domain-containing protein [Candidatus Pacearchaeota archaeon]|nr:NUDIX domain-containing protein [Candidatus Pacearchaeota archaeon]HOL90241.1 NUDIX domain-containing protein [Candidatus Pacearchaeota archaeon]HPO68386.1 NUDIX domain-containing protein [Candidatus Pacearchaeota archaeon]